MGLFRPRVAEPNRRAQIVTRARALLAELPLAELTTRAIAQACEISQPALFRHFASREAILIAVAEQTRLELEAVIGGLLDGGGSPLRQLAALARALAAHIEAHPGLPRLLYADAALAAPELHASVGHLVSMQHTLVSELLRQAAATGELGQGVEPAVGARLFVAMMQGLALAPEAPRDEPPALTGRLEPVLALYLRAVARPPAGVFAAGELVAPSAPAPRSAGQSPALAGAAALSLLDVRPTIRGGRDPLAEILAELERLPPRAALVVVAPFRPAPLERLLAARGHGVSVFGAGAGAHALVCRVGEAEPVLDLRERPAPEPMEAVLEGAGALAPGAVLLALVPRRPELLLPQLTRRGLAYALLPLPDDSHLLRVERPAGPAASPP